MLISPDNSGLKSAASAIKNGELTAFPTDTYFALGSDGLNPSAVEDVFRTKGRNPGIPVPLLIADGGMAESLSTDFPDELRKLTDEYWPGALTVVLPASSNVPSVVTAGTGTVGLRVPDHDLSREFIRLCGTPLTGTSCNITGRDPIKEASIVEQVFGDQIAMCINAACGTAMEPSTVVSYERGEISVLRLGAISVESIRNCVGDIVVS